MNADRDAHGDSAPVEEAVESAADEPALEVIARGGFLMSGLVHLLIGWFAVQLAFGDPSGSADQSGAISAIAQAPGGRVLLWTGGIAMMALAVWSALRAWLAARRARSATSVLTRCLRWAGRAVIYTGLAATVLRFAAGGGASSSAQTESATAGLLGSGAGRVAVVLAAGVVIGIGVGFVVIGAGRRFLQQLERSGHRTVGLALRGTGVLGYIAKGIALVAVGALLGWAGIAAEPQKATGLDGALQALSGVPEGRIVLLLIGIGLIVFGVYCFLRSRYQDM
ncbi:DUF1206 domain-containing protein [Brachybacterium alimentarium]|uniref:DUF1206 domain-containing protein n=1 Tax=Brachybacterium alimentarium TaxID=47845 RepID=UPI003FCF502C